MPSTVSPSPWPKLERLRAAATPLLVLAAVALGAVVLARLLPPLAAAGRLLDDILIARLAPPEPQDDDIVILALSESTLESLVCRSPIDRAFLAGLVGRLEAKGVRAIGLDILIDAPTVPEADTRLRESLLRAQVPVVLITAHEATELNPNQRTYLDRFLAGIEHGYSNLAKDRLDATVRWHEPRAGPDAVSFPARMAELLGAPVADEPFEIAWHGSPDPATGPFRVYPAEAVDLLPAEWLAGKIGLIGVVLSDTDRHRTPLAVLGRSTPGVEIQAHVLSQLLNGRQHPRVGPGLELALAFAFAGLGGLVGSSPIPLVLVALIAPLGPLAYGAVVLLAATQGGPLLPLVPIGLAWLGGVAAMTGRSLWRERQDRQTLMRLFSRHVSAPVAQEIWKERDAFMAGGRPRPQMLTATVLFSDIEGFTPVAERLGPEALIAWLELYLERMVAIVAEERGLVLRFIGDALLAVYGVPVARTREEDITADARAAARTALRMVAAVEALNQELAERGLPAIGLRIGIHTGPLVAGSLGGAAHLEYSLVGDTANTAARLEALGKQFRGSRAGTILLGKPTARRLNGAFRSQPVGEIVLKGKSQKVEVYELLDEAAATTRADPRSDETSLAESRGTR